MDGSTVTDFSIERILSPQLGARPPVGGAHLQGFSPESGSLGLSAPVPVPIRVPVPVPGCLQHRGMSCGEFYPHGGAVQQTDLSGLYPTCGLYVHFSHEPAGYHGYHPAGLTAQAQARQKSRMRTVFTDSQTKQLEALFELSDYPSVEARAQLATSTGLSEETVRVWFKNRRARRKRQRSGSKVRSPSPPRGAAADRKLSSPPSSEPTQAPPAAHRSNSSCAGTPEVKGQLHPAPGPFSRVEVC